MGSRGQPGFMVYLDIKPALQRLTEEQVGRLFLAIFDHVESGAEPSFGDDIALEISWEFIKPRLEQDRESYEKKKSANSQIAKDAWAKRRAEKSELQELRSQTDVCDRMRSQTNAYQLNTNTTQLNTTSTQNNSDDISLSPQNAPTKKTTRFNPPSVDEVREYVTEHGYSVDPEAFVDYYEARDWYSGKTKVRDWRACLRTWQRREPEKPPDITDPASYSYAEGSL